MNVSAPMVITGAAGGAWTATTGITSSSVKATLTTPNKYALGYATGQQYRTALTTPRTTFDGQPIVDSDELIMVTLLGDVTMDGKVNLVDYGKVLANLNTSGKQWMQGDLNYDGKVNLVDVGLILANFNKSLPTGFPADTGMVPIAPLAPTVPTGAPEVPEPASLAVLGIGAAALLSRRRRKA